MQLVVVAALVIIVNQLLLAFAYDVSKQLSVFIGLICHGNAQSECGFHILRDCQEGTHPEEIGEYHVVDKNRPYEKGKKPWPSVLDVIGNGIGYTIILVIVGFFRELLGSGVDVGKILAKPAQRACLEHIVLMQAMPTTAS